MNWRLFPWPSRAERKARVEQARASAEAARAEAVRATRIEQDLHRMRVENHWAEALWELSIRKGR